MLVFVGSSALGNRICAFTTDPTGLVPAGDPVPETAPSFLVRHPRLAVLYAACSVDDGAVTAYAVDLDGGLRPLSRAPSGGMEPVHLAVSADGRHLLCANWGGDGCVAVLPVGPDGALGQLTDVVRPDHSGQTHPHHVSVAGDEVTVVYFSLGRLCGYRLTGTGQLRPTWTAETADPLAGPRHLVRHPAGPRYVSDELASTVSVFLADPATGALRWHRSRRATTRAPISIGRNHPSEVAVSADGRFVYLGNRGPDTVAVFAVEGDDLRLLGEAPTGGLFPRHLALAGDRLYVANEWSHDVTVLRVDAASGRLAPGGAAGRVTSPTCVLPWNGVQ